MKRLAFVVVLLAVGMTGCQSEVSPEKVVEAAGASPEGAPPPARAPEAPGPNAQAPQAPVTPAPVAEAPAPVRSPAAAPVPAEAPSPALTSSPPTLPRVLAAGTVLPLVLRATVASNTSQVGDRVMAELAEDVTEDGRVLLAAGTEVVGRVTVAKQSGRVKGRARLVVEFDEVRDGGSQYRIDASPVDVTAESSKGQDAKIAGGAAAAGAVIGAIAGGGKGALKGGAIGGAAGGAAVLATRGKEVTLEAGTLLEVKLTARAQVD